MNRHAYQLVLSSASAVRILARQVAGDDGLLDEALEALSDRDRAGAVLIAPGETVTAGRLHARRVEDDALLRAVRVLARLGDQDLAGAVAAHPVAGAAGLPSDSSAPASANTFSMGAGSAPDPGSAVVCRRGSGSRRGTPALAPIENTLAGEGIASGQQPAGSRSVPANCSQFQADAPSPVEQTVAFTPVAGGRREGPPAS